MFDAYLLIEGIPGESTATGFEEQIPILSYNHGVSQPTAAVASTGGGATSGRCMHQDFSIVKELDKASPLLDQKCSDGGHIPAITLVLVRSGGDSNVPFMEYKLTNCVVSNVSIGGGAGGGGGVPTESVSFNYGKIEWVYTQTKRPDGGGGGATTGSWNLETNASK